MKTDLFMAFRSPSVRLGALSCLATVLTLGESQAQGTFVPFNWPRVYDQQCTLTGPLGDGLRHRVRFRNAAPLGQSFTPTLSQVGFLQVFMSWDRQDSFTVNLREDSITGPLVGSVGPMVPGWNIAYHYAEIVFPSPVTVVPGGKYVFEIVRNGRGLEEIAYYWANEIDYPGGSMILKGSETPGYDLWFREGIIVPEPKTAVLLLLGGVVLLLRRIGGTTGQRRS